MFKQVAFCNNLPAASFSMTRLFRTPFVLLAEFLLRENLATQVQESEEDLVKRMQNGDDHAFSILYERYFDKLYGFIKKRVGQAQDAEDILSNVFMKAFAHRRRFIWQTSFAAWIYRIATNAITDYFRTKRAAVSIENIEVKDPGDAVHQLDITRLGGELQKVLEQLNERERLVITLKYYGEMDNDEIGKIINCTANNAGVILHRALKKCVNQASNSLKSMMSGL